MHALRKQGLENKSLTRYIETKKDIEKHRIAYLLYLPCRTLLGRYKKATNLTQRDKNENVVQSRV